MYGDNQALVQVLFIPTENFDRVIFQDEERASAEHFEKVKKVDVLTSLQA